MMEKTAILGIGNILLKDDGIGVHVIRALEGENLPDCIELVDGGTSTLDMLGYFMDNPKVIVIDALRAGYAPGTIYKIKPEAIINYRKENLSIHDVHILDIMKMAKMMGGNPEVVIFGIEPWDISPGLELSEAMIQRIPAIIEHVKNELPGNT